MLDHLNVKDINVFIQDWGGLIGLRLVTANPDNCSIVAGNTMLPTGTVTPPQAFLDWQKFATTSPKFDVATVLQRATITELSPEISAAYNAPFLKEEYKAGARIFPALVPTSENDPESENNKAAWGILCNGKTFLTLLAIKTLLLKEGNKCFKANSWNKRSRPPNRFGGHFSRDQGELLAQLMINSTKKIKYTNYTYPILAHFPTNMSSLEKETQHYRLLIESYKVECQGFIQQ